MGKTTGTRFIAEALRAYGVDHVFCCLRKRRS